MIDRLERYFSKLTPVGREHLVRLVQYVSYGMLMLGCFIILIEIINGRF
jgi:hypothetical protein